MGLLWWGLLATADATTLDELVARGQVSVIESQPDGRLQQVTTYGRIDRPVAEVWAKLTAFETYVDWMPQVAKSHVASRTDAAIEVDYSIKVPGPNLTYTARYELDPASWTIRATGTRGAVVGGTWEWKLTDGGDHTLVRRTTYASAVVDNWLVRQFDDDNHTLELSINAISPVVEVRGLEAALER